VEKTTTNLRTAGHQEALKSRPVEQATRGTRLESFISVSSVGFTKGVEMQDTTKRRSDVGKTRQ
jgi:hypothetical protein